MQSYTNVGQLANITQDNDLPAVEADVTMTVWNHIGKKQNTEKLHRPTRKLLIPTSTGIFCFKRNGARTGSGAIRNSTTMKAIANTTPMTTGTMTWALAHWTATELMTTNYTEGLPEDLRCIYYSRKLKWLGPVNELLNEC